MLLRPDLPVLLASGFSDQLLDGSSREFETLSKPYGAEALARAIDLAMEQVREPVPEPARPIPPA